MRFFKSPNQSLRWLLAELAVVVLGILIAFQVDEWRTSRSDDEFAIASIRAILVELEDEYSDIQQAIPSLHQQFGSATELYSLLDAEGNRNSAELIQYYEGIFRGYGFEPNASTYTGLRESGRLYLISNSDLIDQLFDYYEFGGNVGYYYDRSIETRDKLLNSSLLDFRRLPSGIGQPDTLSPEFLPVLIEPINEIPRNPEFLSILALHMARVSGSATSLENLSARNFALQQSINKYLAEL